MREPTVYGGDSSGWIGGALEETCACVFFKLLQQISPNLAARPEIAALKRKLGRKFPVRGLSNRAGPALLFCYDPQRLRGSHTDFVNAPAAKLANQLSCFAELCHGSCRSA